MTNLSLFVLCSLFFSCFGQFQFQFQQKNLHDVLLVSGSGLLEFTENNTLRLMQDDTSVQKEPIDSEFGGLLLRKEPMEDSLRRIFSLPSRTDYQLCISNQSKTLYGSISGYSQCEYDLKIKKQGQVGNIKFNKLWRQQSKVLEEKAEILVDYSEKSIRLPKESLDELVEYLNSTGTSCVIQNQTLTCSNFTSKNYHHDQFQIEIESQSSIKLQLRDLVKQCYELKLCSLWISQSTDSRLKLGSILLKRYSTKFQKEQIKLAPINVQRFRMIKHVQNRKYECMILAGVIILAILYYLKQKPLPVYSKLTQY